MALWKFNLFPCILSSDREKCGYQQNLLASAEIAAEGSAADKRRHRSVSMGSPSNRALYHRMALLLVSLQAQVFAESDIEFLIGKHLQAAIFRTITTRVFSRRWIDDSSARG
jgi:hypothetical protein